MQIQNSKAFIEENIKKNNSTFLEVGETMNKDKMVLQNTDIGKIIISLMILLRLSKVQRISAYRKSMKN